MGDSKVAEGIWRKPWICLRHFLATTYDMSRASYLTRAKNKILSLFLLNGRQTETSPLIHSRIFQVASDAHVSGLGRSTCVEDGRPSQGPQEQGKSEYSGRRSTKVMTPQAVAGKLPAGPPIHSTRRSKPDTVQNPAPKSSWPKSIVQYALLLLPVAYILALRSLIHSGGAAVSGIHTVWGAEIKKVEGLGGDGYILHVTRNLKSRRAIFPALRQSGGFDIETYPLNEDVAVDGMQARIRSRRGRKQRKKLIGGGGRGEAREGPKEPRPALAMLPPHLMTLRTTAWKSKPRTAVCLVGAARDFHLTGPTIVTHLIKAYPNADVFLHSPLDENAHRLALLQAAAPQVVHVRIAPDVPTNESRVTDKLLQWVRSGPDYVTRQQLLQQFKGIEMCVHMITGFERKHGFRYKWVLRTRTDGFWMGAPPPLETLNESGYTIPAGSDWGGLNDRLGVGRREVSWKGLRRLSVLNQLATAGYLNLNAERAYLAQMDHLGVTVGRATFPFCILSTKKGSAGFPVAAALSSRAALNGAKCRPCVPTVTGEEAAEYISRLPERVFGPEGDGVDLCEAEGGWEEGWEEVFDKDAGPQGGAVRKYLNKRSLGECERDWREFEGVVEIWDAPPPLVLCVRRYLGALSKVGFPGGDWPVFLEALGTDPVIYTVVAGNDFTFDYMLMRQHGMGIQAFDGTPAGLKWMNERLDNLPELWKPHPWLLGPKDGEAMVYAMDLAERPFEYSTRLPANLVEETAPPGIPVLFKTLSTTMTELNHTRIDLLRLGGHRSVHEDLISHWMAEGQTPPVCQVSISFHKADKHLGSVEGRELLLQLRDLGLELAICIPQGAVPEERVFESCLFFSVIHCVVHAQS